VGASRPSGIPIVSDPDDRLGEPVALVTDFCGSRAYLR